MSIKTGKGERKIRKRKRTVVADRESASDQLKSDLWESQAKGLVVGQPVTGEWLL